MLLVLVAPSAALAGADDGAQTQVTISGAAGDWVMITQKFPATWGFDGVGNIHLELASPSGSSATVFLRQAAAMIDDGTQFDFDSAYVQKASDDIFDLPQYPNAYCFYAPCVIGVTLAFGADVPWTLVFTMDYDGAQIADPAIVYHAQGAVIQADVGDHLLRSGAPIAGRITFDDTTSSPGWTHLQFNDQRAEVLVGGIAARSYDVQFPNGGRFGSQYAVDQPKSAWTNSYGGHATDDVHACKALGEQLDTAGRITANVTYAEPTLGMSLSYAHLPIAPDDYPPGFLPRSYCNLW